MQAPTQIQKPANWQDFETLCMKLWGRIWDCADTIKKNGRAGQKQYGVDIYIIGSHVLINHLIFIGIIRKLFMVVPIFSILL